MENAQPQPLVVSCDDPYPPRIGLRSHSRVDQIRFVNPEAMAGVRGCMPLSSFIFKLPWARQKLYCTTDNQLIQPWYRWDLEKANVLLKVSPAT